jgi:glycosyltransferase involved in cell wall biosynthesis
MRRSSTSHALDDALADATIALDARLVGYAAGIAQYTTQLTRALAALEGQERYLVLAGRRMRHLAADGLRLRGRRCFTPPHHTWERWTLPVELVVRPPRPALLHSVDHVAPAWGPWRSVVTMHDLAFVRYPETQTRASRAYYSAARESARCANRIIAVSQSTAADVVHLLGADPVRVRVVYEAAGVEYAPRPREDLETLAARLRVDATRPYVLFVGTLEPRKNVPLLLEAFARIRGHLDVQLILAGSRGWLDESIFQTHARLGLKGAAHFVGSLSEPELATLYSHAGAFAFPSLYEGFGLVLLEAMACGAPVVSSNAGPLPEVVGDAGLLLPPEDPSQWAETLARVLSDPTLAGALRSRGFARAASFSWQQAARETRAVYREVLSA